ncbi:MAG TPA: mercuric reductase [Longimicrobiales bacterium]|nr:mercuric reductase [Longimicrobiales bacterium]
MRWDVIILGAGQTGAPLSARLAEAGKRVLLVERKYVGGTCANYGCTPTKTLIASARAAHVARTSAPLGIHVDEVRVDFAAVIERKDAMVRRWREGVEQRLARAGEGLHICRGHGRFVGERALEVDGERHEADAVVIDVGARPAVPPVPGLDGLPWLDNASLMELRELPEHLLVLGGGYIGCELGQAYGRFGAEVTIVDRADHLLAREDAETSEVVEDVFRGEGIRLHLGVSVDEIRRSAAGIEIRTSSGERLAGSHLLVAVGRRPNTDDMGHEAGGIELDERGFIRTDGQYRTSAAGVYAAGDVTGGPQFTHTAWDDHRRLYDLLLGRSAAGRDGRVIPRATFTDPQVAGVGMTEREAREAGIDYEAASFPFGHIARAIETGETAGLLKVLLDPDRDRVLGATIVGVEAAELIHLFVGLMSADTSPRALVDAQFVHPAFAEGVQSLLMKLDRYALE